MSKLAPCPNCDSWRPQATCPCRTPCTVRVVLLPAEAARLVTAMGLAPRWMTGDEVMLWSAIRDQAGRGTTITITAPLGEWEMVRQALDRRRAWHAQRPQGDTLALDALGRMAQAIRVVESRFQPRQAAQAEEPRCGTCGARVSAPPSHREGDAVLCESCALFAP